MKSKFFFDLVNKERIFIPVIIAILRWPFFFVKISFAIDINFFFQKIWLVFLLTCEKYFLKKFSSNLFKPRNKNNGKRCEIYSKLIIKTAERRHWHCFGVFIVDHISPLFLVFLLLSLSMYLFAGLFAALSSTKNQSFLKFFFLQEFKLQGISMLNKNKA